MKFSRKKSAPRQRRVIEQEEQRPKPSLNYYSRRSTEAGNTGRSKLKLTPSKARATHYGRFWLHRFGLLILIIVVLVCAISVVALSNNVKVVSVSDDNKSFYLHDQSTYEQAADKILSHSILNRNKITVNTAQLQSQLKTQFPEITSVSVTLPILGHRPIVYLQTSQPSAVVISAGTAYVTDANGRALIKTNDIGSLASLGLPVVTDQSGINASLGHIVLPNTTVSFISTVVGQLKAKGQNVSTLTLPTGTSELDVQVAGQPYSIKFNLQDATNARSQVGTYLATQEWLAGKNITPSKYIDVRVDGRAYYL